jgi:hypothetical protein
MRVGWEINYIAGTAVSTDSIFIICSLKDEKKHRLLMSNKNLIRSFRKKYRFI